MAALLALIVGFYDWRKLRNREGVSIGQVRRVAIDGVIIGAGAGLFVDASILTTLADGVTLGGLCYGLGWISTEIQARSPLKGRQRARYPLADAGRR